MALPPAAAAAPLWLQCRLRTAPSEKSVWFTFVCCCCCDAPPVVGGGEFLLMSAASEPSAKREIKASAASSWALKNAKKIIQCRSNKKNVSTC